jgi:hypothetical protein
MGPPEKERPPRFPNRQGPNQKSATTTDKAKITTQPRQCRRNAVGRHAGDIWRSGFGAGFRDALRLAAREIDEPAVWSVLSELADRYDLAGEP